LPQPGRVGICHICGNVRPLSYEHVPPRKAFNEKPVIRVNLQEALELGPEAQLKGRIQQRGIGDYTICEKCNNDTGSWYAADYIDWCYQGLEILIKAGRSPTLIYLYKILPLRIIKQIITMFFSINGPDFGDHFPELRRFVLDRERRYLSPKFRVYIYFNIEGRFRSAGISSYLRIDGHEITVLSEFNYPPYGYLMTIDSRCPDPRLFEITHFAKYGYNEFAVMDLKLQALPTHLSYPGDFRTIKEIKKEEASGEAIKGKKEYHRTTK